MTVDELKARRKELLAQKKELCDGGSEALFMVEEELMDVNAHLRALTPGQRIGSKGGRVQVGLATDHQQFTDWAQEDQAGTDEGVDYRAAMVEALAESKGLMTETQWRVFELWATGMAVNQIAMKLGRNRGSVSRTLGRARARIQESASFRMAAARAQLPVRPVMEIDLSDKEIFKVILPSLTEVQIVYLYLYYGEFLSCPEIALLINRNISTVSRTLRRAIKSIAGSFDAVRVYITGMYALGDIAYRFYVGNNDLDELPIEPTPKQPCWGQETLKQQFHVTPRILQHPNPPPPTSVPTPIEEPRLDWTPNPHQLKEPVNTSLSRIETVKDGPRFGKLLSALLERRRVCGAKKEIVFDWLCRIFGAFAGWLVKKR
ncbi:hypothetical protein [Dysosmobacter sp.]|uniref:hypothetical protein n=1 Tax=Dysosmobacter sp. TaxID=2591382 RepID=UPI00307848EC